MQPTIVGAVASAQSVPLVKPQAPAAAAVPLNTGAIVLREEQYPAAEKAMAGLDFAAVPPGDIIKIGLDAEGALQRTLDGFLARLDKKTASAVFALFGRLEQGVEDAKLPEILDLVQNGEKPGILKSIWAKITGRQPDDLIQEILDEVGEIITGRTKTLADEMGKLEGALKDVMQKLFAELQALETLKQSYGTHFAEFTLAAAVSRAFLEKARAYVGAETERAKQNPGDVVAQARLQELQDKLRLLESRALALEGTYTRLPADQLVIQQIEQAGIATLQETATTVAARLASIKMTLLSIHGAFAVKEVQQLAARQARLDKQLTEIRGRALKDVAVSAAQAPGENRLAQAEQIAQVIAATKEIHGLVEAAKKTTEEKFAAARERFAAARAEFADISRS
jgi:hypothetical protein